MVIGFLFLIKKSHFAISERDFNFIISKKY